MISWISQNKLDQHIDILFERASDSLEQSSTRRLRNVVDPFSSLVAASTLGISESNVLDSFQHVESALRGSSNAIGEFHQSVLGSISGWINHDAGYDIECPSRKILAEIKNKHNTMNAANRREVESDLKTALRQKQGNWRGYLVRIIPKTPERHRRTIDNNLFEVDGASFYEIATKDSDAIHDLFDYMLDRISPNEEISTYCQSVMSRSLPPRMNDD